MEITKNSGENLSIIFLDTEGQHHINNPINDQFKTLNELLNFVGFAANNISESYDAKIFAVSTLLSSYLIYNSVKVCVPVFMCLSVCACVCIYVLACKVYMYVCMHICMCVCIHICASNIESCTKSFTDKVTHR